MLLDPDEKVVFDLDEGVVSPSSQNGYVVCQAMIEDVASPQMKECGSERMREIGRDDHIGQNYTKARCFMSWVINTRYT